jgi:hypothetical protein
MRRTSSDDKTRRGDDRPTLPPIRDLFGSTLFPSRCVFRSSLTANDS